MARLTLTIALERYDRHVPFFMGLVKAPEGVTLKALEVGQASPHRDGVNRHGRMLHDKEFDICEESLSSYIIAKKRGAPFIATPVFPRRLFSQGQMWVNVDAGIERPSDLVGKKVGIIAFQVTLSVLAKGDLKFDYNVPWEKIKWYAQGAEELDWKAGDDIFLDRIPDGRNAGDMLVEGKLDGVFSPHPPHVILERTDRVQRLFPDVRGECLKHFKKHGFYPIMHLMVFHEELVEREAWLPSAMIDMWEDAKRQAMDFYSDPGYALLGFARSEYESQLQALGPDPWPSGLKPNKKNLEQFIDYMVDQRLIDEPIPVESMFHESVLDS